MHSSSLAPQMETSLESKFSAAFEQQNASSGSKSQLCNGGNLKRSSSSSTTATATTIATSNTESNGQKTVSFRKGNDLDSFEDLSSLFANGLFTDLVICCTGKIFKCHRVVMAAASLYIRDALSAFYNNNTETNSSCNHNTVMILPKEIKMADMEAILRFVYDGHVEVKVDSIDTFLRSARTLNIKGLSNVNILYNNNGSASATQEAGPIEEMPTRRNNGYSNKNHNSILTNGHAGMNSPPPSPPSLNSSLASLKAMAANHSSSPSPLLNGNLYHNSLAVNNSTKHLNGNLNSHHLLNQYRNHLSKQRDHSLLNDQASALLAHNITPAHQSSTPKSIFNNGSLFTNNNTNSIVPSGGSRRKQRFPTNIPPLLNEMLPPAAAALYHSLLGLNSEDDDEDGDDADEEKKLVIKDDSSNDCSTAGDNISNASLDIVKQPNLPLGIPLNHYNNPQVPCVIEVEADPTTFPSYCHDMNENGALLQSANNKKRRHYPKSQFPHDNVFNKKLKLPFVPGANSTLSNNLDLSINISSPIGPNALQQPSSPADLPKKQGIRNSLLNDPKTVFANVYPNVKTAAGANPSAASPSSSSSASASGAWAGNKWKCDICNKYYGNKQTLKEHMDYFHSNREEQIFICNICNKEYTWRKSLMKHYRDIHQMRNTPALAEINRQLAVLSSAKGGPRSCSPPLSISGDSMPMPAYVSIANTSDRKSFQGVPGMGSNSDKSKSEGDFDNEDNMSENMDHGAKEMMMMGDDDESCDEIEIELDDNDNGRDETSLNGESNLHNNHRNSNNDSSSINKSTNGTNDYSDVDQIDQNSSPPPASSSSLSPSS